MNMSETSATLIDGAKSGLLKRPLFNKPAWSNPQATVDTSDLFHRSNITYVSVATEEAVRRKKKAAKHHQERTRGGASTRPGKRRRISDDSDSEDEHESSNEEPQIGHRENFKSTAKESVEEVTDFVPQEKDRPLLKSFTNTYKETILAGNVKPQQSSPSNVIDLEDEDGDDGEAQASSEDDEVKITAIDRQPLPTYDDFPASDEEFPELARKAREKARRKRLEADSVTALAPDPQMRETPEGSQNPSQPFQNPHHTTTEPIVSLLITSRIPNTASLIVNRRLGQRLKDVRLIWCQRQQLSLEATQDIVLTFRGKQVYDVSSCKSLGIGVNADGNVVMLAEKDIFGEENRKIQMEAMTREMLKELKKAKEQSVRERTAEADLEAQEVPPEQPMKESQIRIILKAKEYEDFKLLVKPVRFMLGILSRLAFY